MENIKSQFDELSSDIKEYVSVNIELSKLKASEKGAELAASAIIHLMISGVVIIALLFLSLALAFYLSEALNSMYSGFLIVAGFYSLVGLLLAFSRNKTFKKLLMNNIIYQIMKKINE